MDPPAYMIAVYTLAPLLAFIIFLIVMYYFCSKRYKLNWFEKTLLEDHRNNEKMKINGSKSSKRDSFPVNLGFQKDAKYSKLSSPTDAKDFSDSEEKDFWVPPSTVQKQRAKSLAPGMPGFEYKRERLVSLPPTTPPLQEITYDFPESEVFGPMRTVQVQSPTRTQHQRQRRLSMQDAIDHTKLDTSLYKEQSIKKLGSIQSSKEENLGSVNFSLDYNLDIGLLTVRLINAMDLSPRESGIPLDPYCKLCILPKRRGLVQSRVHYRTLNPEFEEEFLFELPSEELESSSLQILVYDFDQFSKDECLGKIDVQLGQIDLSEKSVLWKGITPIEKKSKEVIERGDLMFSLTYLSTAERLTVHVMKARHLRAEEEEVKDPYVKVTLLYQGKRFKKKRTGTQYNTLHPVWDEALFFEIGPDMLQSSSLEFEVINDNKKITYDILGRVVIGPDSKGEELEHWTDMLKSTSGRRSAAARWHKLID